MMRNIILIYFLVLSTISVSQTLQDTISKIENAMSIYSPQNPGAQLSIKKNGVVVFSKAYGAANLEHDVPLTLNSKIEAGSVSKQFVAAAILLLEQQGKLSLNDDIRKHLPEIPNYGYPITIEQMMHHTSGLKDWGSIMALTGWPRTTKNYSNDDALSIVAAQKTLNNIPGAEFIYSNSNYNLLAIIVHRVSKQTLAEFCRQMLFTPAGMINTEWRDNHNRIVKNRATAYSITESGYEALMPGEDAHGNGGLLTTTEDLLKWNDYYLSGKFGTPTLLPNQRATVALSNGTMGNYAAGLFLSKYNGINMIGHSGATAAYRANLEYFPELDLSIAFLSNTSEFDSKVRIDKMLRDIFIEDKKQVPKNDVALSLPERLMDAVTGWYKSDISGAALRIEKKNDNLLIDNNVVISQADNRFITGSQKYTIDYGKGLLKSISPETVQYSKMETPIVDIAYFKQYEGKYFSTETNSTIIVVIENGKLKLRIKSNVEYDLQPTYKSGFKILQHDGHLNFLTDHKNKIAGFNITISRARNIRFVKFI